MIKSLGLPILVLLHSGLVLLDELLVLHALLDSGVLLVLLSLASDTLGFEDVVADVASDVLVDTLDLLELGLLELLLRGELAGSLFFSSARLLLVFSLDAPDLFLINLSLLLGLFNELLEAFGEFRAGCVSFRRLQGLILGLGTGTTHDTLNRREVFVKRVQFVLHLVEVAIA